MGLLEVFGDVVVRGPALGCMLMGLAGGLVGCFVFLQKRSLVGEALSHAAYPGVVIALFLSATFFPFSEGLASTAILIGAALTSLLGLFVIERIEKRLKISSDVALCFVLSIFFGVGVLIASRMQITHPLWFRQIQVYLFGQAATMTDHHMILYGTLALLSVMTVALCFRFLQILHFDRDFAKGIGVRERLIGGVMQTLLISTIVLGMRTSGVVLLSAILIAPAAAARYWARGLKSFLILSGLFGMLSGFFGNYLSRHSFPTGPMVALSAAGICFISFLFAPRKGVCIRFIRRVKFRTRSKQENILKALYKKAEFKKPVWLLLQMRLKGWLKNGKLTEVGYKRAEKLIRLHRLWEVYLVHMGQGAERVHHSAEEMEHILTPEIEKQLQTLLGNPKKDPHEQPIPGGER